MAKIKLWVLDRFESIAFLIFCICIVAFLMGCTTVKTEYVKVPPQEPPVITRPALDTDYLKATDDAGTVIQAHRLTIKKLQGWGLELEAALDAYRSNQGPQPSK